MTSVMTAGGQPVESSSRTPTATTSTLERVSGDRNRENGSTLQHQTNDQNQGENVDGQDTDLKRPDQKDSFYMALVHKQNNIQDDLPHTNHPNPYVRNINSDADDQYTESNLSESKDNSYMDLKPSSDELENEEDEGDYVNRLDDPNYENV